MSEDADIGPAAVLLNAGSKARVPLRSVLMTIFIDVGMPRGGVLTAGGLQSLLAGLGYSKGAVRTALVRAVQAGDLVRAQTVDGAAGYGFSTSRRITAGRAVRRLYAARSPIEAPSWLLVHVPDLRPEERDRLSRAGFRSVRRGLHIRPETDLSVEQAIPVRAIVARGRLTLPPDAVKAFRPENLRQEFDEIALALTALLEQSDDLVDLPVEQVASVRIAAIHRWRHLMAEFEPLPGASGADDGWAVEQARAAVMQTYLLAADSSDEWLDTEVGIAGRRRATRIRDRFNPSL